jgi:hypothetical protein
MIYCVWYPSGGFGHFVNAILSLHGKNFVRPKKQLTFSNNGNSHDLDLVVPKYLHGTWTKTFEFNDKKNYSVLIDNGINDESEQFKFVFPNSTIIKICYTDYTWPIVARTMIDKAMESSLEQELPINNWTTQDSWARREKYFLFLRDHPLRSAWKHTTGPLLNVDDLLIYKHLFNMLNSIVKVEPFDQLWTEWHLRNVKYIDSIKIAQEIITLVERKQLCNLDYITDIWTQSVIYYYIWIRFGIEVPHNDFSDFFSNTKQIIKLLA